ncbi:putative reverse transcriptase domain-containing protein, partial [Tanacetum coccineum]
MVFAKLYLGSLVTDALDDILAQTHSRRRETMKFSEVEVSVGVTKEGEATLQKVLEMRLDLSTTLHPQANRQSEGMIQTLEDIMRACVIDFGGSYHLSIQCAPFKALYGRKCRSPVLWDEIGGKPLEFEVGDRVMLKVSPWKGVVVLGGRVSYPR